MCQWGVFSAHSKWRAILQGAGWSQELISSLWFAGVTISAYKQKPHKKQLFTTHVSFRLCRQMLTRAIFFSWFWPINLHGWGKPITSCDSIHGLDNKQWCAYHAGVNHTVRCSVKTCTCREHAVNATLEWPGSSVGAHHLYSAALLTEGHFSAGSPLILQHSLRLRWAHAHRIPTCVHPIASKGNTSHLIKSSGSPFSCISKH